ncbi:MAG: protoheme IX farnesyltransferase [Firmicutes bacterium]|nr:protoheme IX farnesyltransferase [Bacillota bacterium]MBO2521275.1 protoheme IX farnesyltransferase [Bacillota bacterium]
MSQALPRRSLEAAEGRAAAPSFRDFVEITKPKHQFVLFTGFVTMRLAAPELPWDLALFTLLGTALAVASSHVFNQIFDRDIDALMERTKNRPMAAGRIRVPQAAAFGSVLGLLSLAVMAWKTNPLTVLLTVAGWFVYAVVYSYWLKRRSPWCTLVGGISGAMPTLIGWAAVKGNLEAVPLLFFAFMAIWQSPHFFALSLYRADEYRRAGIPVVVVRYGIRSTLRRMLVHGPLLIGCTLLLSAQGVGGAFFLYTTLIAGLLYYAGIIQANREGEKAAAAWGKRLFHASYAYMLLVFACALV